MSGFSLLDVQDAMFELLSKDEVLVAAGWTAHDHVKEGVPFPYIRVGEDTGADASDKDQAGTMVTSDVKFWSQYRGRKELKVAMRRVYDLMHMRKLNMSGQQNVYCHCDTQDVFTEPDGITRQGVLRFRLLTLANPD